MCSMFLQVKPEEYEPRLLHFCGRRGHVVVREVPRCRSRLDSGDVYILDMGQMLYQWNGAGANKDERSGLKRFQKKFIYHDYFCKLYLCT